MEHTSVQNFRVIRIGFMPYLCPFMPFFTIGNGHFSLFSQNALEMGQIMDQDSGYIIVNYVNIKLFFHASNSVTEASDDNDHCLGSTVSRSHNSAFETSNQLF